MLHGRQGTSLHACGLTKACGAAPGVQARMRPWACKRAVRNERRPMRLPGPSGWTSPTGWGTKRTGLSAGSAEHLTFGASTEGYHGTIHNPITLLLLGRLWRLRKRRAVNWRRSRRRGRIPQRRAIPWLHGSFPNLRTGALSTEARSILSRRLPCRGGGRSRGRRRS